VACHPDTLASLADRLESRDWAVDAGSWSLLASIDQALVRLGVVPAEP